MNILSKPFITKKVSSLNEKGVYGLIVDKRANKVEIKKEVEKTYGVTVDSVNTMRYASKRRIRYTRSGTTQSKQPAYKKALVTLKAGEIIDFYNN